jgi:hypothetical protein
MKDEIETLGKKARKKNTNPKDIKLLNRVNEAAACYVEIYNKMKDEDFSTLKKMDKHMQNKKKKTIKSLTVSVVKIILKATTMNTKLRGQKMKL